MTNEYTVIDPKQAVKNDKDLIKHEDTEMSQKLEKCNLSLPSQFSGMSVPDAHKVAQWVQKHPSLEKLAEQKTYSLVNCPQGVTPKQFSAFNKIVLCDRELRQKRQIFSELKLIQSLPHDSSVLSATFKGAVKYLKALAENVTDNQTSIGYSLAVHMIRTYNSIVDNPPMTYNVMPLQTECETVHGMLKLVSTGETTYKDDKFSFKPLNDKKVCDYTASSLRRDIRLSIKSATTPSLQYLEDLVGNRLDNVSAKNIDGQLTCVSTAVKRWNQNAGTKQKIWLRNFYADGVKMVGSKSNGNVYITYGVSPHSRVVHYTKADLKTDLRQTLDSIHGDSVKPVKLIKPRKHTDKPEHRQPQADSNQQDKHAPEQHGDAQLSLF